MQQVLALGPCFNKKQPKFTDVPRALTRTGDSDVKSIAVETASASMIHCISSASSSCLFRDCGTAVTLPRASTQEIKHIWEFCNHHLRWLQHHYQAK
jgi:hypothetical protein